MRYPLASLDLFLTFLEAKPEANKPSRNLHRYRPALISATAQIEAFCGREFSRKIHTEYLTPCRDPGKRIPLDGYPFAASEPHSVKLNGDELPASQFRFEDGSLILLTRTGGESGSLEIQYAAGYPTVIPEKDGVPDPANAYTAAPEDLAMACIYQALMIERMTAQPNIGVDRITADAGVSAARFNMINGFEPTAYKMIVPYRRPPFIGRG